MATKSQLGAEPGTALWRSFNSVSRPWALCPSGYSYIVIVVNVSALFRSSVFTHGAKEPGVSSATPQPGTHNKIHRWHCSYGLGGI